MGRAGLQTSRKQQQGSEVRTPRCCLDTKRRICAQNKGGERRYLNNMRHSAGWASIERRAWRLAGSRLPNGNGKLVGGASCTQKKGARKSVCPPGGAFGFAVISIEGLQIKHNVIYSQRPASDNLMLELFANEG